ncbi:carbohydrate ABC transporter substrate-binding protein (CUT1 family) [Anaerobacterium chartisolvens]|uniref:Carbohydrate ABC transporter substrate-binding protein (CUT1 family) n=1 Tax=Anaerobacterium chartisolvens TaxID=1297424 RepID=A0A369BFM8_9FIRM|nr:extracellular solute-binding protein [Anaerobacterium chartisolvens]RCX19366.1 carbohydrate ABC transporter substrate-binding protein (CUT1 family) [Anaerobacterium chartisolvens]
MVKIRMSGFRAVLSLVLLAAVIITGCTDTHISRRKQQGELNGSKSGRLEKAPFYPGNDGLYDIEAPEGFDWKQFDGTTLNFLVENNIYANVLTKESEQFTKLTGISVNIRPMDFSTLVQKINLDFITKTGKAQIIYADPYQTLNRFSDNLEDLKRFNDDPSLPHIPGGMEDFFEKQVETDSYFISKDKLYTVPFDSTTMILYYRKDIFEKYKDKFMADKGYDWAPGKKGFTWERYGEISRWITEHVPKDEVKYGSGHMAKRHNSLYCDFSNVLASYGGDYFPDENVGSLGVKEPEQSGFNEESFIKALEMYKKIIDSAAPESLSWNWYYAAEAFKAGEIAMMPNWDENASSFEDMNISKVAGKVGYSILPYGPVRSANIFGGTGIGINKYSSEREKRAAWLFVVWATSPQTELLVLKHPEGGVIPSRKSVYNDAEVKDKLSGKIIDSAGEKTLLTLPTVVTAWKDENAYYRPKIGSGYAFENIVVDQLHRMLAENIGAGEIAEAMLKQINNLKK